MDLTQILEDLATHQISIEEAARRAQIVETEPGYYNCGTCQFFKQGICHRPGNPPRFEHPMSIRCGDYQKHDPRDEAMLLERKPSGSRMFK
jgi:hypothetical protein